jgi:hypothetical protein
VGLFERWLWKVSKLIVVFLSIATEFAIDCVSCISCLVGNGFDNTP